MQESAQGLLLALLLAVTFIYIVLASQFESFTEPIIIMLALPLALVGALLMLLVTGQHLGMPAMIGIVMLMGLVTKNADSSGRSHEPAAAREASVSSRPFSRRARSGCGRF